MEAMTPDYEVGTSSEVRRLREENNSLRVDLEECKSRLFELLQEDHQVSEASIKKDYIGICDAIEAWIDYATADEKGDFRRYYREVVRYERESSRYEREHLRSGKRRPKIEDLGLDPSLDPQKLGDYDGSNYFILSLVIQRQLDIYIFQRPYPIGVTNSQARLLEEIEEGMQSDRLGKGT
jgi:hypothetical protein